MQGTQRRRIVHNTSLKIPLRRYFSGLAAVGYSLLLFSLLLTPGGMVLYTSMYLVPTG